MENSRQFCKPTTVIQNEWHMTPEGENFLGKFCSPSSTGRRLYGVLERPALFDGIEEVTYKVAFIGKSGVGKTSAISYLAGLSGGGVHHSDTLGIQVTDVYWPVKVWDKVIVFKLQCWDAGDASAKKYSHILEACQDKVDLRIFVFSYNEASSFTELPTYINSCNDKDTNQPAAIALGTRNCSKINVTPSEIKTFQANYGIEVYVLPNTTGMQREDSNELIAVLNSICELLWLRDQHYILNNSVTV